MNAEIPPETPAWITPELVAETLRVWQPYYKDVLTPADAITMVLDVGRLFSLLGDRLETVRSARAG